MTPQERQRKKEYDQAQIAKLRRKVNNPAAMLKRWKRETKKDIAWYELTFGEKYNELD